MLGQGKAPFYMPVTVAGKSYYTGAIARLLHLPQQITFTQISCRVANFLNGSSEIMPENDKTVER